MATKQTTKPTTKPTTKQATKPKSQVVYNRMVKAARSASQRAGAANWIIGDSALTVATEYGENTIKRFADDIGTEVATVRNMRTVSARYPAGDVARDLQTWTVYAVFAGQDDAFSLVADGNDGAPWTVSAARALVKSRNASTEGSEGSEDSEGSEGSEDSEESEIDKTRRHIAQLESQLANARAKLAKLLEGTEDAPATKAPATKAPATKAPATKAPATKAPATKAPATKAPATKAPATKAPAGPRVARTRIARNDLPHVTAASIRASHGR